MPVKLHVVSKMQLRNCGAVMQGCAGLGDRRYERSCLSDDRNRPATTDADLRAFVADRKHSVTVIVLSHRRAVLPRARPSQQVLAEFDTRNSQSMTVSFALPLTAAAALACAINCPGMSRGRPLCSISTATPVTTKPSSH